LREGVLPQVEIFEARVQFEVGPHVRSLLMEDAKRLLGERHQVHARVTQAQPIKRLEGRQHLPQLSHVLGYHHHLLESASGHRPGKEQREGAELLSNEMTGAGPATGVRGVQ
jgi:hypothetical protein